MNLKDRLIEISNGCNKMTYSDIIDILIDRAKNNKTFACIDDNLVHTSDMMLLEFNEGLKVEFVTGIGASPDFAIAKYWSVSGK